MNEIQKKKKVKEEKGGHKNQMRQIGNKYQDDSFKYKHVNNFITCKMV